MSELRVDSLFTYPIKSCAGTRLGQADITPRGLQYDRDFMAVDENKVFISQRTEPSLALVKPVIEEAGVPEDSTLRVSAPKMEDLVIPLHLDGWGSRVVDARVHDTPVVGVEAAPEADDWFSTYLNKHTQLLTVVGDPPRPMKERYRRENTANQVGFADAFPILLATKPSLYALNPVTEQAIPMNRFRPNIVVEGEDLEPFDEDYWRRVQIGTMIAYVVRPCKRCDIPYVDQNTGKKTDSKWVGGALARERRGEDTTKSGATGVFFAQNIAHVYEPGLRLAEGDEVVVLDRSADRNVKLRNEI